MQRAMRISWIVALLFVIAFLIGLLFPTAVYGLVAAARHGDCSESLLWQNACDVVLAGMRIYVVLAAVELLFVAVILTIVQAQPRREWGWLVAMLAPPLASVVFLPVYIALQWRASGIDGWPPHDDWVATMVVVEFLAFCLAAGQEIGVVYAIRATVRGRGERLQRAMRICWLIALGLMLIIVFHWFFAFVEYAGFSVSPRSALFTRRRGAARCLSRWTRLGRQVLQ
jgi:hypothetical protein